MRVDYEETFFRDVIDGLAYIGHVVNKVNSDEGFAAVNAISQRNGLIEAVFDWRRNGSAVLV